MESIHHREFVKNLVGSCATHEQWVSVMRFGLPSLLKDPRLLMECIASHAQHLADLQNADPKDPPVFHWEVAPHLLDELGLWFSLTSPLQNTTQVG